MSWGDQTFGAGVFKIGKPQPWTRDALCAQIGADLWFPDKGESAAAAKAVCRGCPVVQECLKYALDNNERTGVWGAMSERDRRKLHRGVAAEELGPPPLDPLKCGTTAQYKAHNRRGEKACESCRRANALDFSERRRRRAA